MVVVNTALSCIFCLMNMMSHDMVLNKMDVLISLKYYGWIMLSANKHGIQLFQYSSHWLRLLITYVSDDAFERQFTENCLCEDVNHNFINNLHWLCHFILPHSNPNAVSLYCGPGRTREETESAEFYFLLWISWGSADWVCSNRCCL